MDILLLADVLVAFRAMCLENYQIDPLHSYTVPGFAWQAALKMTGIELDLVSDKDMYLFLVSAKRGGTCVVSKRFANANIPGTSDYNPSNPTSYIIYQDMNNLYGHAMVQSLPTGKLKWVTITKDEILTTADDAEYGYILEVDLEYPSYLHDQHNDYPLAPEHLEITQEMLSPLQNSSFESLKLNSSKKLAPNLHDKKNYVLHYRNLKYYLDQGMILKKIHRALKFQQSPWLKPFIEFNTQQRANARSDFEKDFFKLLNNSVFGKTIENTREYRNVDLVDSKEKMEKLAKQPNYRCHTIINENLIAVERFKPTVKMDKPIYTGISVFELSKLSMYKFHYELIKKIYPGQKSKVCMTDTDSFVYEIETENIYDDMRQHHEHFDLSNFEDDHPMFCNDNADTIKHLKNKNKKVLGKMKDELAGKTLLQFVGIRPKAYSLKYEEMVFLDEQGKVSKEPTHRPELRISESKKLKGIKKSTVENDIRHEHYMNCLHNGDPLHATMTTFRSHDHKMSTRTQNKLALCNFDDKRWIMEDGISTYAHGHYKTTEMKTLPL